MILTLLASLLLGTLFFLIGAGVVSRILGPSQYFFPISVILGFSVMIYVSWLRVNFGQVVTPVALILFLGLTFLSLTNLSVNTLWRILPLNLLFFFPGFLLIALCHYSGVLYQGIRVRTGPDFLGWTIASNYFQKSDNLEVLRTSLESQLGSRDLFFSSSATSSVYSIPSFTEQVQAEFLLASGRIGITSFVGFLSRVSIWFDTKTLLVALMAVFAGISSIILFTYFRKNGVRIKTQILAFLFTIASTSLIAPIFEGGIWHILVIPVLICLIVNLTSMPTGLDSLKIDCILVGVLLSMIISISTDVLAVSLPIFIAIFVKYIRFRRWTYIVSFVPLAVFLTPGLHIIASSINSRSGDAFLGGWSATSIGLPGDFVGLTLWQTPTGSYVNDNHATSLQLFAGVLATFVAFAIYRGSDRYLKKNLMPYFLSLGLIFCFVYSNIVSASTSNHYVTWKLAFLWVLPFSVLLPSFFDLKSESRKRLDRSSKSNSRLRHASEVKASVETFLISWLLVIFAIFANHWAENSKVLIASSAIASQGSNQHKIAGYINQYQVVTACGVPWYQGLAIYGDMHLIGERRSGTNVKVDASSRKKMVILNENKSNCLYSLNKFESFKEIAKVDGWDFYEVVTKAKQETGR